MSKEQSKAIVKIRGHSKGRGLGRSAAGGWRGGLLIGSGGKRTFYLTRSDFPGSDHLGACVV